MKALRRLWNRLTALGRRRDFSAELESHLQMQTEENLRAGMPPGEARRAAVLKFGSVEAAKESLRDQNGFPWLESLFKDLRYAFRVLRKNPGFTAVAVLTLTLGIGASSAIFSIVNGILLRPLPYPDADRIVGLNTSWMQLGRSAPRLSGGDFLDVRANRPFEALGLYSGGEIGVEVGNRGEFSGAYFVTTEFQQVFSMTPLYGRLLVDADAGQGALVSLAFANRVFGSGDAALGKQISVEHQPYTIAGVLPAGFEFPRKADVWLAAPSRLWNVNRTSYSYYVVAKLNAGASLEKAQAQLDGVAARLSAAFPESNAGKTFSLTPLRDRLVGPVSATLWLLIAAVSLVLLIACANVANLLLARASGRSREIALRAALGASRWRILRQLIVENAILAATACLLGAILAGAGIQAFLFFSPENLPRIGEVHVDREIFAFAAALSLVAISIFGLAPAWQASRIDLQHALKRGGRLRSALVVAEVSLSVVLAIGAGLLFRGFLALSSVELGYRTENRLVMYTHVPAHGLDEYLRVASSFDRLLLEFAAIPGVQSAAAAMGVPTGRYGSNGYYFIEAPSPRNPPNAGFLLASPRYFATMGVPLLRGREFAAQDRYDAPFVAIVNQALVRRSFANEDPIGKRIKCGLDAPGKWMTIVGVVGDVRQDSPASAPQPELYMPLSQHPYYANEVQMVLRTSLPPTALVEPARRRMHELNPTAAVSFTTLDQMVAASIATPRFRAFLTVAFGALALLLAMIGVYGVMNYLTAQRTSEFGLRLALGAKPADLLFDVLRRAALLAIAGLVLGAIVSIACGRLVTGMLYGLKAEDPATYAAVLIGMFAVTLAAAAVPALRAARVDPVSALRQE